MSLFEDASKYIPGGVNSPVRAFRGVGGEPIFFKKAQGAHVTAADGRRFIDYVGSWGPMILGHAHPQVHVFGVGRDNGFSRPPVFVLNLQNPRQFLKRRSWLGSGP